LAERVRVLRVLQRNKKPVRLKVLSTLLYYASLSYRVAAGFASVEMPVSYEAVRLWRRSLQEAIPKPRLRRRRLVVIDETKLKLNGEQFYLWAASLIAGHLQRTGNATARRLHLSPSGAHGCFQPPRLICVSPLLRRRKVS